MVFESKMNIVLILHIKLVCLETRQCSNVRLQTVKLHPEFTLATS